MRGPGTLSNTMLLGTTRLVHTAKAVRRNEMPFGRDTRVTRMSLPNGISFRPTALAGCTSVTYDIHTYRRTDGQTTLR